VFCNTHLLWSGQRFFKVYSSQGSVATQLRCDGIFSNRCITNFPQNLSTKRYSKSVNYIWRRYGQNLWLTFLAHPV